MGGHTAGSEFPLDGGIRKIQTVSAGGKFLCSLAAFTLFDNRVAVSTIKPTTRFVHEKAIDALFYACTNHGYHALSLNFEKNEARFMHYSA